MVPNALTFPGPRHESRFARRRTTARATARHRLSALSIPGRLPRRGLRNLTDATTADAAAAHRLGALAIRGPVSAIKVRDTPWGKPREYAATGAGRPGNSTPYREVTS